MSNTLTVQDPEEGTAEVATETRQKLQEWADKHLPSGNDGGIKALDDSTVKALRADGAEYLSDAAFVLANKTNFAPTSEFSKLLAAFSYGTRVMTEAFHVESKARELTHVFEGLTREFHKQFFQAGMKWNLHAEYLAVLSLHAPHRTSGVQDTLLQKHLSSVEGLGCSCSSTLGQRHESEDYYVWAKLPDQSAERFKSLGEWAASQVTSSIGEEGVEYWDRKALRMDSAGAQLHYMDEDGPWVAGFLNLDDACRMRFRRIRLGAYLTEQGMSDSVVRARVEKAKQLVAGAVFEAWPNDTRWEDVYTSGPSSCMSDSAGEYACWDDLHPVDAYSSSFHGCGDNNLVLLVSKDGDGNVDGRGILNLQWGNIVRWYGNNVAERVLLRNGVHTSDRTSMDGTWLALLEQGKRFLHPYVDGDLSYGKIEDGRVYIVDDNDYPCVQETGGSSYRGKTAWCVDVEKNLGEDEAEWQPISRNYISCECDDSWRCPVIGEFARYYDRSEMSIHGIEVAVSDTVRYDTGRFLSRDGARDTWSIDDADQRQAFFNEYGIEEDDEDEDEEAA